MRRCGTLVLMLPGTGGNPADYRRLLAVPLAIGHHVISLAYPNTTAVGQLAGNDLAAYGPIRREIVSGEDASSLVAVGRVDSIEARTAALLAHLAATWPDEGWGAYLDGSAVRWEAVMAAGFSQGAGHAAWLASTRLLKRAVMLSGVVDGRVADPRASADWIAAPGWATPADRLRFFESIHDGLYPAIRANLVTLGQNPDASGLMVGSALGSLSARSLYLCDEVTGDQAHPSTADDRATPLNPDGSPRYRAVWQRLFE